MNVAYTEDFLVVGKGGSAPPLPILLQPIEIQSSLSIFRFRLDFHCDSCRTRERPLSDMKRFAPTIMVCLIALSAAGCAVEVPVSALRMGPSDADAEQPSNADGPQDIKHAR